MAEKHQPLNSLCFENSSVMEEKTSKEEKSEKRKKLCFECLECMEIFSNFGHKCRLFRTQSETIHISVRHPFRWLP